MDKQPILSICIPTNGIVEWMIPVVESIYAQKVDNNLFEVVITDNGGKDDLKKAMQSYDYPNLHYYKTTSQGFTNQIDAFEKCSGLFCKMLNHRSKMMPGSINSLLGLIEKYKEEKPIIYCAEGNAKGGDLIECDNTDQFVHSMSYWVSWSAGTGAWKSDIIDVREKQIDKYFPHIVFLFGLRDESKYVIWNVKYEIMGSDEGKGGYNVFDAFGITLLDILSELRIRERITLETFVTVKKDLYGFIKNLFFNEVVMPTKHTFITKNIPEIMNVYYGRYYYYKMVLWACIRVPFAYLKWLVLYVYKYIRK